MAKPDIEKTLVVSTGNLQQATCDMIGTPDHDCVSVAWEYGGWVHTLSAAECKEPELKAILHHAASLGCTWVRFDCDADLLPDTFPRWEW